MNISNTVPIVQNSDNETVTLIALPLQLFQQATQHSLIVEQNVLFKTFPDGTLIIDTNQLLNGSNNVALTTAPESNVINEKSTENPDTLIYTKQQKTYRNVQTNHIDGISKTNDLNPKENKNKSKIRFLQNKLSLDVRRVGRPRKDDIKTNNSDKNAPFKCELCDKEFQKYLLFKRHEKSHVNEKKYKCPSCPASFNILSNHILHLAIHNTEDPTCPECGKKFQRIASLKAHMMYHEKEENFYCEDCNILFNSEIDMNEHIKEHESDKKVEISSLQCKYCQLTFTNQTEFRKHLSEHTKMRSILQTSSRKKSRKTTNAERKHECTICSKAFHKRSQIERHMRVHSGEKPYICKICDRGFSQKGSLQIHMTRHTGARPHNCALCQAKFSQKGNLRAHILKTHSVPQGGQNVFSCSECSCVFKRLGSLNGHMTRNHPRENNSDIKYVISQLAAMQGNTVADNDILQEAINKSDLPEVQNQNNEKNNETSTATYVTLADLGLDGNMRRYLIKQRRVGDIRWHLCSFCPKEFKKPSDLVRHLRVHTREKPFVCKYCCRSFAVKSTLTTHIKTHTKCTEVQCTYCYKFFRSWTTLNAHMLKHTAQKHKCTLCSKSYRTTAKLSKHYQFHLSNMPYEQNSNNLIMLQPIKITNKGLEPVISLRIRPLAEAGCKGRPYTCKVCGAGFRRLSHLKQHFMKHSTERPYRCHLCFRHFGSCNILKTHILTHSGARPYKCVVCQKNFSTNGSLKRHLQSHSTAKPFLCPYCFLDFKNLLQCRKHMVVHSNEVYQMETNAELSNVNLTNDIHYPTDLTDALVDDPFSVVQPLSEPNIEHTNQDIDAVRIQTPMVTQTLRADETGTVVLPVMANQENLTQENLREIEDTLNSQMLNIIGSENFIDSSTYVNRFNASEPIISTDELVNTLSENTVIEKSIEENPFLYQQVIVNLNPDPEQIPILENNGIDHILSHVKFQNESLFFADLNSLNINNVNVNETNNVLLPFQIAPQSDLQPNQFIVIPPGIEQEIQTATLNSPLENIDQNIQLKLNEFNGFLNSSQNITDTNVVSIESQPDFLNTEENIIDNTIANINVTTLPVKTVENNITDVITDDNNVAGVNPSDIITDTNNLTCNLCKHQFDSKNDLKVHHCINFVKVEMNTPDISSNDDNNTEDSAQTKETLDSTVNSDAKEIFKKFISQNEKRNSVVVKKSPPVYKNCCTYCPKSFRKPSDLQRHLRTHTGERPFKCDKCAKSFSLKSTLENHSKIHQGRKEFTCHVCNCLFASKGSLSVHMRLHTGVKPFKCHLCHLKFRTSGHRKTHLAVHYKEALKTGKVPSDVVTRKAKMAELMEGVQNMIDLNLIEKEKDNKESELLLEDIPVTPAVQITQPVVDNIVLQTDEKPLMHFEIETNTQGQIINIKPTASNILFVDETSKEEVVSTQVEFDEKTKQQIENFLRDKKAKQQEIKNRTKKVCNVCNKEFGTKYLLDRHRKIHTGEKRFSCNYCTKMFNQKNALQSHVRTHLGSRPYRCPHCWNTFTQSGNLKTHIKRIHGGNNQNEESENSGLIVTNILQTDNLAR